MTRDAILMFAAGRLAEIQDNAARWALPDSTWAEILNRTPDGDWSQAFRISSGQVSALTDPVWIPVSL